MTGERLAQLMIDPHMKAIVHKAARRYTKCPEDQEEYMQDAWMRIAGCDDDKSDEYLETQGKLAIKASYYRKRYSNVQKEIPQNLYGISVRTVPKRVPRDALALGRGRYLLRKPEKLSSWYYDGEWKDYGLDKDGVQVRTFYQIVVM